VRHKTDLKVSGKPLPGTTRLNTVTDNPDSVTEVASEVTPDDLNNYLPTNPISTTVIRLTNGKYHVKQ
jgi:hypothetical protein